MNIKRGIASAIVFLTAFFGNFMDTFTGMIGSGELKQDIKGNVRNATKRSKQGVYDYIDYMMIKWIEMIAYLKEKLGRLGRK